MGNAGHARVARGCGRNDLRASLGCGSVRHQQAGDSDGRSLKVDWINPHIYIHLDVKDDQGVVTTWRLASLPTAMLRKAGITSQMLVGDGATVTADAILARDGTQHLAWVSKLTYEDGHFYQLAGE